jgi:Zn-dependent protease with chaperone function
MNTPQPAQKCDILAISTMPNNTFTINRRPSAKQVFAGVMRAGSLCVLAWLLVSQIIVMPPQKFNYIEVFVLAFLAAAMPYLITAFQRSFSYYREYEDDKVIRRIRDITGVRRMWMLHRKSDETPKLFARGTGFLHIALMKGNLNVLSEDEIIAVIVHEVGHNRYWHYPVYLAAGFFLLYLLRPYGGEGLISAIVSTRVMCYFMEAAADRYVYRSGLRTPFLSAVAKMEDKPHKWIEYVPILNLLVMYPKRISER